MRVGRPHLAGLALAGAGGAAVLAATLPLADRALPAIFAVALLLGAAFAWLDFGFAGGFRALLEEGDPRPVGASLVIPAVAALVILPVAGLAEGYVRYIAPVGLQLLIGAAMFGLGMQVANGCGSGVLVAAGQGSRRMFVALPFFCLGGVLGALLLPMGAMLPAFEAIDLLELLGPWGGLLATEALLGVFAIAFLRGRPLPWPALRAGAVIGALAALLFLASGTPWGITTGLTLWAAKPLQALGWDLAAQPFWQVDWARDALAGPVLANHASLSDIGLVLGALAASAWQGGLRHRVRLGWRGALGAALGGLLMGVGARLSAGCNVGAFIGGAASGSLHGFVWLLAVIPGCWIGIRLRPVFGLPRR
ncbi:YeeE/YedE thiosulfate transporter family protein [Falsiroseomonas ponticola]|uniref:YeeE/YedE thiosulfate transporter family protein n=1 Tax=Falsiroseomonas ponticola TaxID=2786951 RepID=UPI001931F829|nr:YeeE/YedE thiosulfate transporter family protein [Roseomonas ponticola]